jgi:mono/diheme cytochrome c family protein
MFVVLAACSFGPESTTGFSLPKGNITAGEKVFMHYRCLACHTLDGFEDATVLKEFDQPVPLGGTHAVVKTYAQLVTSVINPSHKITAHSQLNLAAKTDADGRSKMRIFNEVMTVQELIDLVAFLQPQYQVAPITYTHYGQYRML